MPKTPPAVLMLIPTPFLLGALIGLIVGLIAGSFVAGAVTLLVVSLVSAVALYLAAEKIALRLLNARPLAAGGSTLLRNSLDELCARTGLGEPDLYTAGPGPAAIASLGRGHPSLVVTDGLTDELTVIELEAALARELARAMSGSTNVDTLAVPFITLPLAMFGEVPTRVLQWFRGGDYDARCDLEGVGITRYPPGMSAALEKMTTSDRPAPPGSSAVAHLWATGREPASKKPGIYGVDERLELLREL